MNIFRQQIEWKETTLGKISSDIAYGYTESATSENIGPKFLRITDIQKDFIDWDHVPHCPISEKNLQKYKLKIGDVVIARTGNSTGATATIRDEENAVFASYLIRFKIDPQQADFRFVDFLLRSDFWKSFVKSVKGGSAQGGANAKNFASFPILLPPLPEQHAIAAVLSAIDDKIELLRQQNQTLEAMAQALFKEWFVDFNFPNEKGKPYRKSGGKMMDSELGEIPEGWRVDKLTFVAKHYKKNIKPHEHPEKAFYHYSIPAFDDGKKPVFENGSEIKSNKYEVVEDSILISKLNPRTPRVWMVLSAERNSICSTEFQVAIPSEKRYFAYAFSILSSKDYSERLASKAQGTSSSHQRVRPADIFDTNIPTPTERVIDSYHYVVYPILKKSDQNLRQIQTLTSLRDTLLPRLMRGEVRVHV